MLRDVRLSKIDDGKKIKIRRKSGATFTDIGEMIDDVASNVTMINVLPSKRNGCCMLQWDFADALLLS